MTGGKEERCDPDPNRRDPNWRDPDRQDPDWQDPRQDLDRLAERWIALWQDELAGIATDPELAQAWHQALGLGAAWLRAVRPDERACASPGAAAPGAASGAGDGNPPGGVDAGGLRARIESLERRLAALEHGAAPGGADRRGPRRKRPAT